MTTLNNRIKWIDTAKGLGLLCVILGHLGVPYLSTWIYTFHMPLFFFLSGIVFSGRKYRFGEYLKRKMKSLVLPYFTLGGGIFLFFCIVYAVQRQPISAYGEMLKCFLVQEHFWTVWFLACLFLVELLYYGIYMLCGKWPLWSTAASLTLCVFGLVRYRLGWGSLPWNLDVALVAQFFFHIGYLSKKYMSRLGKIAQMPWLKKGLALFGLLALSAIPGFLCIRLSGSSLDMSIGMYGNELLTFISAFAGIGLIVLISNLLKHKWLTWLGQNTMIIFGWHSRIVIVLCGYVYAWIGVFQGARGLLDEMMYAAVTMIVILGILVPLTLAIKKSKLHWLFGM